MGYVHIFDIMQRMFVNGMIVSCKSCRRQCRKTQSVGRLFQMSGPETAKFLGPMVVAVRCTLCLPEAADLRCRPPASTTTGWQSSARSGAAIPSSTC